jgi:Flp pilus assembly protein TadD
MGHQKSANFIATSSLASSLLIGFIFWAAQGPPSSSRAVVHSSLSATAKAKLDDGRQLLLRGNTDAAVTAVKEAIRLAPRSVEGYNLLGLIYDRQRRFNESVAAFRKALNLDPNSPITHNNLGMSYSSQQKFVLAEREFRATLRLNRIDRAANYNLGLVLLASKQPRQAIAFLRNVHPPDAATMLNLVRAYFQCGETGKGLELTRTLSEQARNDVRLHFSLGVVLAAERRFPAAEQEFALADALTPGTFEILYNLGQAYLRNGERDKAENTLKRALVAKPDSAQAMYLLAKLYADQRKDLQAMELLAKARRLAPQNPDVIFLMGRLSMLENYFEDAIQLLEKGIELAPKRPDLHAALGESYFNAGNVDKAIQEFRTLIKLDPSAGSYNFMGLCYRHLGRFGEAKKYFLEGLELDPKNADCLYNLGYIANRQGDHQSAKKYLGLAIESDPNYADALYELASVKMSEKKFEEAIPLLRRSLKQTRKHGEVYYKLAAAERATHQKEAAERDLRIFETLAKEPAKQPYPFQHFFDVVSERARMPEQEKAKLDLAQLTQEAERNPTQPNTLYLLADTCLKLGRRAEAGKWVAQLDNVSQGDVRTAIGLGVLLARFRAYSDALQHFQIALRGDPDSDEAKYNLANTYFQMGDYAHALAAIEQVSPSARNDLSILTLLGDIDAHLGRTKEAIEIFTSAAQMNPENEQYCLSLALAYLRAGDPHGAEKALQQALAHTPDSGKLFWGMGIVAAVDGRTHDTEEFLNKALELMPEWQSGYSALAMFYYETGQINKAREIVDRYVRVFPNGGVDIRRIQQMLESSRNQDTFIGPRTLSPEARQRFLQIALALADESS